MNKWMMAGVLAAALLGLVARANAASMHGTTVTVTVDVPKFGLVRAFSASGPTNSWSFTLTLDETDENLTDGVTFKTSGYNSGDYYLKVWSNTDVTVKLSGGGVPGATTGQAEYSWEKAISADPGKVYSPYRVPPGGPWTLYVSGGPSKGVPINLTQLRIVNIDPGELEAGNRALENLTVTIEPTVL